VLHHEFRGKEQVSECVLRGPRTGGRLLCTGDAREGDEHGDGGDED
jgi:hypothetical protein